jgi:hypothetical protein
VGASAFDVGLTFASSCLAHPQSMTTSAKQATQLPTETLGRIRSLTASSLKDQG